MLTIVDTTLSTGQGSCFVSVVVLCCCVVDLLTEITPLAARVGEGTPCQRVNMSTCQQWSQHPAAGRCSYQDWPLTLIGGR